MKATERMVACFLLFGALPRLAAARHRQPPVLILGVPALVLYLFAVWAAIVVVLVALARRRRAPEDES